MIKFFYSIIIILSVIGSQWLVRLTVKKLNKRIEEVSLILRQGVEKSSKSDFGKESDDFKMILKTKEGLGFITNIIGLIEMIIFSGFTILLTQHYSNNFFEIIIALVKVSGGWLALKIFGSYHQWSGAVLGRAYFYVFLMGSIINIFFSVIMGYVLWLLFF